MLDCWVRRYDKDLTGRGDFLGRIVLAGPRTILSQPHTKLYHKLERRPDKGDKFNKCVAGRLGLTAAYEDRENAKCSSFGAPLTN